MTSMTRLLVFFCGVCAWAQSGIEVPSIGTIVDSTGALRQVQGVAGSFLLGPIELSGVLSAACSKRLCLAKTDSKILSATGETDAPSGPAIFDLGDKEAIIFFPEPHTFARWRNDSLEPLDWVVEDEILSITVKKIAVRSNEETSIVQSDGSVVDSIPEATGPVLLLPKGIVFATKDEIVLRQDDTEVRYALANARSITPMGPPYVAIYVADAIYALRTDQGRESLFLLPGTTP